MSRNSARFLWKSTPQEAKDARPELAAVWRIGQCLWNRDYAGVYAAAQGFEWSPEIADFVAAFLGTGCCFTVHDGNVEQLNYSVSLCKVVLLTRMNCILW